LIACRQQEHEERQARRCQPTPPPRTPT
jgi:hypothetical protein